MRFSLVISVIFHVVLLGALLYIFRVVPEMRLPQKIYSVKILQPIIKSRPPEPKVEEKAEVEKPKPKKPEPAKPKKKETKKEPEPQPEEIKPEEKPLDVSVDKEEPAQTSLEIDAPRFPFSYYLEAIERKVSQNWFAATSAGNEGLSCVVYFRLKRSGSVDEVRLETSSGNSYFDRTALRAVRSASPFPPLPRAFTESYLGIHFTFLQRD
jgi:TonB family protein